MARGNRQLMFMFSTKKKPYPIQLELTLEQDQQTIYLDDFWTHYPTQSMTP